MVTKQVEDFDACLVSEADQAAVIERQTLTVLERLGHVGKVTVGADRGF